MDGNRSVAPETAHPGHPTVDAVAGAVRGLGVGGVGLLLWTGIVIAGLLKGDRAIIDLIWTDLYRTWVVLAILAVVVKACFVVWGVVSAKETKPAPVPVLVPLKPQHLATEPEVPAGLSMDGG